MLIRKLLVVLVLVICALVSQGQEYQVEATNQPLNQVLLHLRDVYGWHLSFNDQEMANQPVSLKGSYPSAAKLLTALLAPTPFGYKLAGNVYVVYTVPVQAAKPRFVCSGVVVDAENRETLPFSQIIINGRGMLTDVKGQFSFASIDSVFRIKVSYLGYFVLDTLLGTLHHHVLRMQAQTMQMREVLVEGQRVEQSVQMEGVAGTLRINHKIAAYLPGNGDNSVFNLLRLQPGVLASGELSSELVIWGAGEGQNQVLFDGFTIFGLKNFNDNINAVNPLMAKDIKVLKGGYGAEHGGRVGGRAIITGVDGNPNRATAKLTVNNTTINGYASAPLLGKGVLMAAARQTYYNLYDPYQINPYADRRGPREPQRRDTIDVYPEYTFRDINLKYTGETANKGKYYLSFLHGSDAYGYELDENWGTALLSSRTSERNNQTGAAAFFSQVWDNGNSSRFTASYSGLDKKYENSRLFDFGPNQKNTVKGTTESTNFLNVLALKNSNRIVINQLHVLNTGLELETDHIGYTEYKAGTNNIDEYRKAHRVGAFFEDMIDVGKQLQVNVGLRLDVPTVNANLYLQPRLSGVLYLNKHLRLNGAVGIYNQFIANTVQLDEQGNYRYVWAACDNETVPVLSSVHSVLGISYTNQGFSAGLEGYHKTTDGLTRYLDSPKVPRGVYRGDSKNWGIDFLAKQDHKWFSAWVSYSLSKSLEHFNYFNSTTYNRALLDQLHEFKCAAMVNLHPFYLAADYVYGSGFPDATNQQGGQTTGQDYKRLDVSTTYRYVAKRFTLETGISILNVLDRENIKQENLTKILPSNSNSIYINSESVPFTPTLYLNISI